MKCSWVSLENAELESFMYNNCVTVSMCLIINAYFDWKPTLEVTRCDNLKRLPSIRTYIHVGCRMRYKSSMCKYTILVNFVMILRCNSVSKFSCWSQYIHSYSGGHIIVPIFILTMLAEVWFTVLVIPMVIPVVIPDIWLRFTPLFTRSNYKINTIES